MSQAPFSVDAPETRETLPVVDMENVGRIDSGSWLFKLRRSGPPRIKMPPKPKSRLYFAAGTLICASDLARVCKVHRHTVRFWQLRGWVPPLDEGRFWRAETINGWENALTRKYLR